MNSIENNSQSAVKIDSMDMANATAIKVPVFKKPEMEEPVEEVVVQRDSNTEESTETKIRRSFFDRYVDKIKDFLDNAE